MTRRWRYRDTPDVCEFLVGDHLFCGNPAEFTSQALSGGQFRVHVCAEHASAPDVIDLRPIDKGGLRHA
jgi:hypothetical protein